MYPSLLKTIFLLFLISKVNSFLSTSKFTSSINQQLSRSTNNMILLAKPKHKVTVQHDGKEFILEVAEDYSILNAAIDAGVSLPYDCNLGVCLTCPSRVISGKIDQAGSTLDDSVMEQGFALTCTSYPRSDVVIRSIDEDELVSAQFKR